jgi:hypothetical protein
MGNEAMNSTSEMRVLTFEELRYVSGGLSEGDKPKPLPKDEDNRFTSIWDRFFSETAQEKRVK